MDKTRHRSCGRCKSEMVYTTVEHPYWHDDVLVALIHDVPSWVCRLCNHRVFEPAVEITLHQLVRDYIKLGQMFPIPSTPYRSIQNPLNSPLN